MCFVTPKNLFNPSIIPGFSISSMVVLLFEDLSCVSKPLFTIKKIVNYNAVVLFDKVVLTDIFDIHLDNEATQLKYGGRRILKATPIEGIHLGY